MWRDGVLAMIGTLNGSQVQQSWSQLQLWAPQLWDHLLILVAIHHFPAVMSDCAKLA